MAIEPIQPKTTLFPSFPDLHYTELYDFIDQILIPSDHILSKLVLNHRLLKLSSNPQKPDSFLLDKLLLKLSKRRNSISEIECANEVPDFISKKRSHSIISTPTKRRNTNYKLPSDQHYEDGTVDIETPSPKRRSSSLRKRPFSIEKERHEIWTYLSKKAIPKAHKSYLSVCTAQAINAKKLGHLCAREVRRVDFRGTRLLREYPHRARRLMRDMLSFWKRNEKEEKELRKRAEKMALEARKAEEEAREARRQSRKLDFLINQTELYSHFMASKLAGQTESTSTTSGADDSAVSLDTLFDAEQSDEALHIRAKQEALRAVEAQRQHTQGFNDMSFLNPSGMPEDVEAQPLMLECVLKRYQLRGLAWLSNLYEQGINGILADEMGLGKTVQSIALLAHLAERHGIWGPFLVVTPASTLHNWQQELSRFVPEMRTLPYWGTVGERKVLRGVWLGAGSRFGTKEAPFHVLITSYQLVVVDQKYFQRVTWQYMVLDEAQAIKSASSARWKVLLGLRCRNRLLLTGTPIQNSMAELWALLHFIMPTLFDSHDEFAAWFSKDIESQASSGGLDARQLRRLHMVLKPFMLRRLKKDVENELGEKREVVVECGLSARQRQLYAALQRQLLGKGLVHAGEAQLMNLVMQFRKVCNHPELLLPRQPSSPFGCTPSGHGHGSEEGEWLEFDVAHRSYLDVNLPLLIVDDISRPFLERNMSINRISSGFDRKKIFPFGLGVFDNETDQKCCRGDAEIKMTVDSGFQIPHIVVPKATAPSPMVVFRSPEWTRGGILYDWLGADGYGRASTAALIMPTVTDWILESGKMYALVELLRTLRQHGHRVLVYFQMTRMIDMAEDVLREMRWSYLRLDGSSKIGDRRDMVSDWQSNESIFCFLLSTRAGGLGINLTAADTVIFYDSDWNPTVDEQAMDRAHRLGQTKQVTVYRLLTRDTIEERIQKRAAEKHEIQRVVIAGGEFRAVASDMSSEELFSLLADDCVDKPKE